MIHILLFLLILLLPVCSEAAYKIYLKNGSVISGVSTYEKHGGQYTIYFGGGSMRISEAEILKIEETEAPEKDFRLQETLEMETTEQAPAVPFEESIPSEKADRANSLKAELEAIEAELKSVEENEARVTASINEKQTRRRTNVYQFRLLQKELKPLQEELSTIQQKKTGLLQRRAFIEGELRYLQ